ncbi:efflux RND transporter permease subunit [Paraburkholderia caribensis]|uniref:efflux RND transporter permease subunit n=1 Tax=Paraburkholderia caribensis TaxID=75105 RepID=UPI001CB63AA3|nr:multidrug efflux RND transporter permease subunit [Paraburkholderia caribensis]CAG9243735.1 Efflux pump membrane transporter BepE [Paraburkholderia caribensis]
MKSLSSYFIDRPIFAGVLSVIFLIAGAIALLKLPVSQYPDIVPPTIVVRATFPGASPQTIADTVSTPLEEQINGVENMLYTSSQATSDGQLNITVTFALGTNIDTAQVQVQNRVSQVLSRLPDAVQRLGVTTEKSSPEITMVVHLVSPNHRYDGLYLSNYARTHIKDDLARLDGVGDVEIYGAGEYSMRVWLDPQKMAQRGLTAPDVIRAIREQNVEVAAGALGSPPVSTRDAFQLNVTTDGRLVTEDQFRQIILRSSGDSGVIHLGDVARVELGADLYARRSLLDNQPAAGIVILQRPGSNAIHTSEQVMATMAALKKNFPDGVDFRVVRDDTKFERASIEAVVHTLFEAIILVVLVVILFLQTWRASLIPLIAVPVSLIGTFAVMQVVGFSLNTLSLFGLVLAIGIVVDDAIVVVENVERHIELGANPKDASRLAMKEVTSPIIATALVLCAVFVPAAFISGLTGQFYRQFALTIAISTVISAFNSLTLSPALSALLLKGHDEPKDIVSRVIERLFGWIFRPFNRLFISGAGRYVSGVQRVLGRSSAAVVLYAGLMALAVFGFMKVPTGFVPTLDKQLLIAYAQLPSGSSLDRTEDVVRQMGDMAVNTPGVWRSASFPGLSINGFTNSSDSGVLFLLLKPFDERQDPSMSAPAIISQLSKKFSTISGASVGVVPAPPVDGIGSTGGFRMQIEDRAGYGSAELQRQLDKLILLGSKEPALCPLYSSYDARVPQVHVVVDHEKAKVKGVNMTDVADTLAAFTGTLYVNDFNRFGRTYQVNLSADPAFRRSVDDITQLKVRNAQGDMVPLGSFVTVQKSVGTERTMHYNGYPTAEINGGAAPGYSTGQAQAVMEKLARENLPKGMTFEWTELTYQQILAGNTAIYVFPLSVLLVFMVLASLYESLSLPLAVILIVPMVLLSAIAGVWLSHGDNNIFTQIGLIVLVGLACKNAILIVEFAKEAQDRGLDRTAAVLEAARLRLRPILMTSVAFIMGVVPLVSAHGAGAEMRHALGIAVFAGMLGVTLFGLMYTPLFYVLIRGFIERAEKRRGMRVQQLRALEEQ